MFSRPVLVDLFVLQSGHEFLCALLAVINGSGLLMNIANIGWPSLSQ